MRAAAERGLVDFNILIVQKVFYNSLTPFYRELFTEIDLKDESLVGDFQMMYDKDARYIYFTCSNDYSSSRFMKTLTSSVDSSST